MLLPWKKSMIRESFCPQMWPQAVLRWLCWRITQTYYNTAMIITSIQANSETAKAINQSCFPYTLREPNPGNIIKKLWIYDSRHQKKKLGCSIAKNFLINRLIFSVDFIANIVASKQMKNKNSWEIPLSLSCTERIEALQKILHTHSICWLTKAIAIQFCGKTCSSKSLASMHINHSLTPCSLFPTFQSHFVAYFSPFLYRFGSF